MMCRTHLAPRPCRSAEPEKNICSASKQTPYYLHEQAVLSISPPIKNDVTEYVAVSFLRSRVTVLCTSIFVIVLLVYECQPTSEVLHNFSEVVLTPVYKPVYAWQKGYFDLYGARDHPSSRCLPSFWFSVQDVEPSSSLVSHFLKMQRFA